MNLYEVVYRWKGATFTSKVEATSKRNAQERVYEECFGAVILSTKDTLIRTAW
jgi:hypothetical protein